MEKRTRILAWITAGVLLFVAIIGVLIASCTPGFYSEKQHIARVRSRAEKRYLGEGSEYTGLEVYPVYNEKDELKYMLIELQPQGFMYVEIGNSFLNAFGVSGMYTRAGNDEPLSWMPYRVKKGNTDVITREDGGYDSYRDTEFFRDENGQVIVYHESHFKVAGIENERRYLLDAGDSSVIPAVRREEQYLNLVDGELMDYEVGKDYSEVYPIAQIVFIGKSYFDL